jgi:hypothetical protein
MPPDTQPPPVIAPPVRIQSFWLAARQLSTQEGTRSHREIIDALRRFADAGELLAPERSADVDAIRRAADALEHSRPRSTWHADYTRYGLDAAVRLLVAASPPYGVYSEEYGKLLRQLRRDVEAVDPDAPLLKQHRAVARAFETAARAMYAAYGAVPPDAGELDTRADAQ